MRNTLIKHTGLSVALMWAALPCRMAQAETARYRLTWNADPATTMVVIWEQRSGNAASLRYGTTDEGVDADAYPNAVDPSKTAVIAGMSTSFVRLQNLSPDTPYYFVIRDSEGTSPRFWFKTAPAAATPFTLIAGGDTRNNRVPRRRGNLLVARLRPVAALMGGDFTDRNTDLEWQDWFDDWQSSISEDGRMYPLIATQGNHDYGPMLHELWDTPSADNYYALPFGGDLLRVYTLNSEIAPGGNQQAWLDAELAAHSCAVFNIAQYHRPIRPHQSAKGEGLDRYAAWASIFHQRGMNLAVECDSHVVKRTWPLRPDSAGDEGFVRDDATGTVYIGEGCWGAPLRANDDDKSWTRASGSFNQLDWLHVTPERLEVRTLVIDAADGVQSVIDDDPFTAPAGLRVWDMGDGPVITIDAPLRSTASGEACELVLAPAAGDAGVLPVDGVAPEDPESPESAAGCATTVRTGGGVAGALGLLFGAFGLSLRRWRRRRAG